MQFVENKENIKRIYEITFDENEIKELIDKIVEFASYKVEGTHYIPYEQTAMIDDNEFKPLITLPNGKPIFTNIKKMYECATPDISALHGEDVAFVGTRIIAPQLSIILKRILEGDEKALYDLVDYENNEELIPIETKVIKANKKVNEIDNYDVDNKIAALKELKKVLEKSKSEEFSNEFLLRNYYSKALALIRMHLISETVYKEEPEISLNHYLK